MASHRSFLALSGVLLGLLTASPAQAVAVDETYLVPSNGSFSVEGHGWGHGHGLSQTGAQGAATLGKSADFITSFYYPGTTKTTLAPAAIRVLVSADTGGDTQVYPATGLTVTDLATGDVVTLPTGPTRWRTTTDAAGLHLQSYTSGWTAFTLNAKTTFTGPIQFGGVSTVRLALPDGTSRDYRGSMRSLRTSASSVQSINVLSMESYLAGVVPRESSSSWKPAALQAQAIAARTYSAENRSRYATTRAYDICDTTQCQVYGGQAVYTASGTKTSLEATTTSDAVTATANVIRTYQGKPIFAQFSASNGGWSTDGGQPYLIAQQDPYDGAVVSTIHSWSATITAAQLQARFPSIGTLKSVHITERDGNGEWGGRVKTVVLQGTSANVTTTGAGFYNAHSWPASNDGLRSSWWHITAASAAQVVTQSAAPTLVQSPGQSTGTLTVTMKNSGSVSWPTANLHLIVSSPPAQADPLVGNTRTPGRYSGSAASIAPGETAAFSFALTGDSVPVGLQGRAYRLAIGGGQPFGDTVSWKVPVVRPVFTGTAAPATSLETRPAGAPQDQPDTVLADGRTVVLPTGGSARIRLSAKNTGNVSWTPTTVRMGTSNPRSRPTDPNPSSGAGWLSSSRPAAPTTTTAAGAVGSFDVTLYGNNRPLGVTKAVFEPVWEGVHWIDRAPSNLFLVRVDPSQPKQATLENAPSSLALNNGPPVTTSVRIRLRNVGREPWTVGSERLTGAATPLSTSAWIDATTPPALGANASRPGQVKVYPGEVGEWLVPLSASRKPAGTYTLSFQPKGYGPKVPVKVIVANVVLKASVTKVSSTVSVPRNGSATSYFEVKNTGTIAWPLSGDLHSEVLAPGGSPSRASSWISATRPGGLGLNVTHPGATTVKPGEVGRFSVVLAGNNRAPAATSEQFGLVWETWQNIGGLRATLAYRIV